MLKKFSEAYLKNYFLILLVDILITVCSFFFAYLLRFNLDLDQFLDIYFLYAMLIAIFIRAISYYFGKTYHNIIKYTSARDVERIFTTVTIGSLVLIAVNLVINSVNFSFRIPLSVILIDYFVLIFSLLAFRIVVRIVFQRMHYPNRDVKKVLIFGTNDLAIVTKRVLERDVKLGLKPVAFLDCDTNKIGKKIEGFPILDLKDFDKIVDENNIKRIFIAKNDYSEDKYRIIDLSIKNNIKVSKVPKISNWINGELSVGQIKKVNINDLLGRKSIDIDDELICKEFNNKVVLVTGAAGSIGSEIVRQLTKYSPKEIILFDQAETPMYNIEIELLSLKIKSNLTFIIGDVRDVEQISSVFGSNNIDYVFHAAAYKHVPLMESNPAEAVKTNIFGTKNVVDMALKYNVKKFLMISTDKAVNPTNVMGMTKRIAEIYSQTKSQHSGTKFITTRFGNVLGSNGSVIPYFEKQLAKGGPLTVTHPEITRYFMTIPEACQLVLQACTNGTGGEIFVFDMGKPVKIVELAKKMIKLSGLELGKDIQIKFIGLRPGEKLYEELLSDNENTIPTYHEKIRKAKVRGYDQAYVDKKLEDIKDSLYHSDNYDIVATMKDLVPEFESTNLLYSMKKYKTKSKVVIEGVVSKSSENIDGSRLVN